MAFAKRTALKAFCRDFIGWIWAALAGLACDCGSGRGVACVYRNVEAALLELFFNIDLAGRFKCQEVSAHPTDFVSAHRALGNVDCGAGQVGAHDVAFGGRSVSVDPYQAFLVGDGAHGGAYLKRAVKFRGMTLGEVGQKTGRPGAAVTVIDGQISVDGERERNRNRDEHFSRYAVRQVVFIFDALQAFSFGSLVLPLQGSS